MKQQWTFSALDTLFFKESRPIESIGGAQLASVFPPPIKTIAGAIRTAIGEALGVNWTEFSANKSPLNAIIGTQHQLAPLQIGGPYLLRDNYRLYPMPAAFLHSQQGQTRLTPGIKGSFCDLGFVQLPTKQDAHIAGAKPLENAYLTEQGMQQFLSLQPITDKEIIPANHLYVTEERLGIARHNATRMVQDGALYQTRHVRPLAQAQLQIGVTLTGLNASNLPEKGILKLGAEGRSAAWQRDFAPPLFNLDRPKTGVKGLLLMLVTPALFERGWLLDNFAECTLTEPNTLIYWLGEIAGIKLKLHSAAIGKPYREGGWDMVKHAPKTMQSYAPIGSCYFCTVIDTDIWQAQQQLHGRQVGQETEWGRGEIVVGYW